MNLEELRKLEAEATPGPWLTDGRGILGNRQIPGPVQRGGPTISAARSDVYAALGSADADLVAAARNALPDILETLAAMRTALDALSSDRPMVDASTAVLLDVADQRLQMLEEGVTAEDLAEVRLRREDA